MPALSRVALALGSNLGDRANNLQSALDALMDSGALSDVVVSGTYETEPVGGPEQGPYLNAVIRGKTSLIPHALLREAHRIEDELGRARMIHWGPRTIDIDILAYENEVLETEDLVIPHRRAHERAFVLLPWSEIDSEYVIAAQGTVAQCLAAVSRTGVVLREDAKLHVTTGGI